MKMNVHHSPQNKNDLDTAYQKLQCVNPNSYHCLRTEDGGETKQCLRKVWIEDGGRVVIYVSCIIVISLRLKLKKTKKTVDFLLNIV